MQFRRKPKASPARPATFDRAARDRLRARPTVVVPSDAHLMLISDSRAEHVLVDPFTMRVAKVARRGAFGSRVRRGTHHVILTGTRAQRRARTAGAR